MRLARPTLTRGRNRTATVIALTVLLQLLLVTSGQIPAANASTTAVTPIVWASFSAPYPTDADSTRVRNILNNATKYALTTWWNNVKNFDAQDPATYLDFGGVGESSIRPPGMEAVALAVSLKTNTYAPTVTGVSTATATSRALNLIRSVAYRHLANSAGGWGNAWQTALWATFAGTAGWLMWDDLNATDQEYVRKMVEHEANRFIGYQVPYYRAPDGTILTPGDTKAEENAWNATVLGLALAMMPDHPSKDAWTYKFNELNISEYARPSDPTSTTMVNGRQIKDWLYGSNVNSDGTAVNHNIIHPDYMVSPNLALHSALVLRMAGLSANQSMFFNTGYAYDALVDVNFSSPPYDAPGGTIYKDGTGDIYHPQGNDWGTSRRMQFVIADVFARAFNLDGLVAEKASTWEPLHASVVTTMQARFTDGRTYGASTEDTYAGREEWVAHHAAWAAWTKWLMAQGAIPRTDQASPIVIDNLDREFSIMSGTWNLGETSNTTRLGANTRSHAPQAGTPDRVRFTPRLGAGTYAVYAWWTQWSNRSLSATYTTNHAAGTSNVSVDQRANGGQWNYLGTYSFNAGTSGNVELRAASDGYVAADAVKFVKQ